MLEIVLQILSLFDVKGSYYYCKAEILAGLVESPFLISSVSSEAMIMGILVMWMSVILWGGVLQ